MTAICAIVDKKNKRTILASDKLGSNRFTGQAYKTRKIFKVGILAIAMCGSYRMGQVLQHNLKPREFQNNETIENYIFNYLETEIRKLFKEKGILSITNNVERIDGGEFIVGIKDRIFVLQGDVAFLEPERIYATSGSGQWHQEASIHTQLIMNPKKDYKQILEDAILYTSEIVVSVGGGVEILEHRHE